MADFKENLPGGRSSGRRRVSNADRVGERISQSKRHDSSGGSSSGGGSKLPSGLGCLTLPMILLTLALISGLILLF